MSRLARLAVVTLAVAAAGLLLGGDAGGGAPLAETLHRILTALGGLLALATAALTTVVRGVSAASRRTAWSAAVAALALPLLGAVARLDAWSSWLAPLHVVLAFGLLGLLLATAYNLALDRAAPAWLVAAAAPGEPGRRIARFAAIGLGASAVMVLTGAATAGVSPLACPGWPFCLEGTPLPADTSAATAFHLAHRAAAIVGAVALAAVAWLTHRRPAPRLARRLAEWTIGVLAVQVMLGGNVVAAGETAWFRGGHLAVGTLLWSMGVLTLAALLRPSAIAARPVGASPRALGQASPAGVVLARANLPAATNGTAPAAAGTFAAPWAAAVPGWPNLARLRSTVTDYVALTKPGILTLLLTTTLCAMLIADPRGVSLFVIVATLIGGTLAAGGANALNCLIDRDIDVAMARTRHRASAAGRISPPAILAFGLALSALAVLALGLLVNWLAAALALAGNLFYVLVYTRWLKRSTPHNIVIGGAAGAVPPLVGWAAATGGLAPAAWVLFAIIFAWTPPHFWALALLKQGEYGRAAVPMLPVVAGETATRRQILLYSVLLFATALLLVPLGLGPIYLLAALALNGVFLGLAVRLWLAPSKKLARQLFFFSLWYLALLFAAAVVDRLILA